MERHGIQIRSRVILIVIGAATVVVALIAFSGICWGTISAISGWLREWTFWEFFALSAIVLGALLMVLPIGRRLAWRRVRAVDTGAAPFNDAAAIASDAPPFDCNQQDASWRDLYDQLSTEERAEFKALMEKYCGCGERAAAKPDDAAPQRETE